MSASIQCTYLPITSCLIPASESNGFTFSLNILLACFLPPTGLMKIKSFFGLLKPRIEAELLRRLED